MCVFFRYKDGCEILPSDNITLQAEGCMRRLIVRSADISDAGSYTCQAGNNSVEFTVNIKGASTVLICDVQKVFKYICTYQPHST